MEFSPSRKPIVYNVLQTSNGWQIQAFLPTRISPDDRMKVLVWFDTYRTEVHRQNPLWLTNFRASGQAYFLDIVPVNDNKSLIARVIEAGTSWHQMDFQYG